MISLEGKRIAVFDLEIKNPIESLPNGWNSHDKMGISVLCLYDYLTSRYRVFDDKNFNECLKILNEYDFVVGYNTVNFDWRVVQATWFPNPNKRISKDFDMLREIWISLGLNPDVFNPITHGKTKLDQIAQETIGMKKSGDGALAPRLYQEGRIADVIDYCIEDVRIEKTLFEFIINHGYLVRFDKIIPISRKLF